MAEVSQKYKYVKLDDGVSFALVRTNPKLTTNTKLMYNGKKMYMESYASSELLNRSVYKNVSVKQNSIFNKDIASFLVGSGSQAYSVYQNFSDVTISDSYDNQFENFYWCGAEYVDSSFYTEEIGFVAPLYLREKLPNYFLIFRLDTPSNYNLVIDDDTKIPKDSAFDFKADILDKAVLIKTFDLREGTVLGNYIHNYIDQEGFEFDKSMYVNFSNGEVTYYGIDKISGVLEKKVESFDNELLKNDGPVLIDDKWFTGGFERNGLIFPYIINIEYLFNDDNFQYNGEETYDFARYIGVYCNNIEFGEFADLSELKVTEDNAIYYFEDNRRNLHRYSNDGYDLKIDNKNVNDFDMNLISGFESDRVTGYGEPLDIYEGFINRAQYGFEILKPLEPGDWIGIEYNGHVDCYFADNNNAGGESISKGDFSGFRFFVSENSTTNDIAEALANSVNHNRKSKFEAKCSDNVIAFYVKQEGKQYNGSETGGAKILMEASLIYNRKVSLPISDHFEFVNGDEYPVENISDSDSIVPVTGVTSSFGDYYKDYFCGACNVDIDNITDTYRNIFKIYSDEYEFFDIGRYLKTKNGDGRRICANMIYINLDGKVDSEYRIVIVDDAPVGKENDRGYDVSVSSTYQVEIMDRFKPNHGVLSWFPVKDFDFDINYSTYGQYAAFADECSKLAKSVEYTLNGENTGESGDSDMIDALANFDKSIETRIENIAKSPFRDDYGEQLESEYDYYLEQYLPDLCLVSKSVPYISKWGYYDEQKDSCENPYRLNVNKVFGVSNLSANTHLRKCDENEYTHSMPYYMTMDVSDYIKEYQYIATDDIYAAHTGKNVTEEYTDSEDGYNFNSVLDCVEYWVGVFMNTDVDMFSHFFSGKKYGKRFDKKYSRLLGGDKIHNPSTLFRGVKFEAVRQYSGVEKRSSEYNDYKFSFVYIPVMISSMFFDGKVYFVKNDTFKFIVGMVFVNTMLGQYNHNIFGGDVNYFNKGFLYAACKDIIKAQGSENLEYVLKIGKFNEQDEGKEYNVENIFWKNRLGRTFYMWKGDDGYIIVSDTVNVDKIDNIIGEFRYDEDYEGSDSDSDIIIDDGVSQNEIEKIYEFKGENVTSFEYVDNNCFKLNRRQYYKEYDATIYTCGTYQPFKTILCKLIGYHIELKNNRLVDICVIDWDYHDKNGFGGYILDVSNLYFKSASIKNILINLGNENSVSSIKFFTDEIDDNKKPILSKTFNDDVIKVDYQYGSICINSPETVIETFGSNGEKIENLKVDIIINDKFNDNLESLALKNYFSVFNQISMCNIADSINNDINVKYYSTIEDNKYKMRVVNPDSIEIEDRYEAIPTKVTQNNKSVVGSVEIKEKQNVDKIGSKVINRYSGFYNPIFNDILYYDDYTYIETVGRLGDKEFELPYSNTHIDYDYNDGFGQFGVIKNLCYHKTNTSRSDKILTSKKSIYPAINEYALDFRDYNIFSSSWDDGYFISQDDLETRSVCSGIGSMKEGLCMFGSKYLNLPDYIFIDTFENGKMWDEKVVIDNSDNTNTEIIYKEINNRTVKYHLFIEKRLKRYLVEHLFEVFSKYINKKYSFGNKGTIEDDVEEYVEKNLLRLYAVDKVYMYIKSEPMRMNDKHIENEYLKYVSMSNELKIKNGFPIISNSDEPKMKESPFSMHKVNEFDRIITYNLKSGFKESFGFAVSFRRK